MQIDGEVCHLGRAEMGFMLKAEIMQLSNGNLFSVLL